MSGTETSNWAQALQEAVCVYVHIACVGGVGGISVRLGMQVMLVSFVCLFFGFARGLVSVRRSREAV